MKKNKIVEFVKNNWYFSFLVIPFVILGMSNKTPNNDIWFLMNNGRYVLNYGIPHIDPFTIHEGLHYVMQQWLSSIILYTLYKLFGKYGLLLFTIGMFILLITICYKLCHLISNNKIISVILTTIAISLTSPYITTRPQVFTFIILLSETYLLELFIKKDNWHYLIPLPLLSFLLINLHASMWFLQFIFILPFIVNGINIKKITIRKIKLKPILITTLLMFIIGFINPYGIEAITFIFKSYGLPEINGRIEEMKNPIFKDFIWYVNTISLIIMIILIMFKKIKMDTRFICFMLGLYIFNCLHSKSTVYYALWSGYIISSIIIDKSLLKRIKKVKIKKHKDKFLLISYSVSICLISTGVSALVLLTMAYSMQTNNIDNVTNYILKNYKTEDVVLFVGFNDGGYTEYNGLKSYLDPRAELFNKKNNKKENILKEYNSLKKETIHNFLEKYNFTHIIVDINSFNLLYYLKENSTNYIIEYREKSSNNNPAVILYVRKDLSIKEKTNNN